MLKYIYSSSIQGGVFMNERLLEPLKYYETEGRATHEQNANAYFDNLVSKSGINV